jgi:hypothetical protein
VSLARKQLEAAFRLLSTVDAIQDVTWSPSKTGLATLLIERGKNLTPPYHRPQLGMNLGEQEFSEQIVVQELWDRKTAEQHLVGEFYRLELGNLRHPPVAGAPSVGAVTVT